MTYKLGVLPGDDIGLEATPEAVRVGRAALEAAGVAAEWIDIPIGMPAYNDLGTTMPDDTLDRLSALDGWILGPIGHMLYPKGDPRAINPHPIIRRHFDLRANIRPARSYPNVKSIHQDVDVVIVRENNEGFQPDRNMYRGAGEFMPTPDLAMSVRVVTREACDFIARVSFDLARTRRKHVTAIHKNTVFKMGCGLFAEVCQDVAREYPDVAYDEVIVDTFALKLVMDPHQFDVIAITNMFGDIMSDLAAGIVGGLGLGPALQMGKDFAMAQAAHGSAPDIAGRGIADPYALIISLKMLFDWLAERKDDPRVAAAAAAMQRAVDRNMAEGHALTPDLGGTASTEEMGKAIAALVPGCMG